MKKLLILVGISCIALTGCVTNPVPTTKIKGEIAGQLFSFEGPKDTVATNVVVEVTTSPTNKIAKLSIGYIAATNSSNVISNAYSGAAELVNSIGTQVNNGVNNGAAIAGKFAGAAAKP